LLWLKKQLKNPKTLSGIMNKKSQGTLEFLLLYGTILVLIIFLVGVFFFILLPQASTFKCTSNNPEKLTIKNFSVPELGHKTEQWEPRWIDIWESSSDWQKNKIVLENKTGNQIMITKVECAIDEKFGSGWNWCNSASGYLTDKYNWTMKVNNIFVFQLDMEDIPGPIIEPRGEINLQDFQIVYDDYFGVGGKPPGQIKLSFIESGSDKEDSVIIACYGYPGTLKGVYSS
jgi:hypothetical protein